MRGEIRTRFLASFFIPFFHNAFIKSCLLQKLVVDLEMTLTLNSMSTLNSLPNLPALSKMGVENEFSIKNLNLTLI